MNGCVCKRYGGAAAASDSSAFVRFAVFDNTVLKFRLAAAAGNINGAAECSGYAFTAFKRQVFQLERFAVRYTENGMSIRAEAAAVCVKHGRRCTVGLFYCDVFGDVYVAEVGIGA